jgi:hypothetical protein
MSTETSPDVCLIDALASPSSTGVEKAFGDEVRFRSPYADYEGRADVAHLVGLIREVLVDVAPKRRLHDQGTMISLFEARVSDEHVQGMLFERHDDAGRLVDAMLTIRPYRGLRAAMKAMQALLDDAPLPSAR